jgi:hypothetical protein
VDSWQALSLAQRFLAITVTHLVTSQGITLHDVEGKTSITISDLLPFQHFTDTEE